MYVYYTDPQQLFFHDHTSLYYRHPKKYFCIIPCLQFSNLLQLLNTQLCEDCLFFFGKVHRNLNISRTKHFFFKKKKEKHYLYIKGNFMLKKRFAANVIFSRRPQNQKKKKKNVEKSRSPQGKCFPQNVTSLSDSKNSHFPQSSWEILPQHTECEVGGGGEDT